MFGKRVLVIDYQHIANVLGVSVGSFRGKYLGFLMRIGLSINLEFQYILDLVWKKLSGQKNKFLSQAGKEVIHALPLYIMQCFLLSLTFLRN